MSKISSSPDFTTSLDPMQPSNDTLVAKDSVPSPAKKVRTATKRRSFKGLSLEQRQNERREKLIEAGLQVYGSQGFFSVTVRDVCNEAKLTERYFYESFKRSEELFKTIFLRLIEQLQQNILSAVMQSNADPRLMIEVGLRALFKFLRDDPRMARILYIDAILVHEMQGSTIHESMARFDRMIQAILLLVLPKKPTQDMSLSLMATGLNGYVTHIAIRWVTGGFKEPLEQVLNSCKIAYVSILDWIEKETSKTTY